MFDMNMDIQHLMEACDKSSGACSYNGKKKGNDANTNDPSSNEGCCKKEVCPTTNEVCKNEGCKRESSIFDGAFQALDEFKGEAELAYAYRRSNESGSHEHNGGGKVWSKSGKNNINSNNHNMSYELDRLKGKNKEETKRNYDSQAEYHKNVADTYHKSMDSYKDPVAHSIAKHNKKVNRESASIFDGAFQALDEFKGDTEMQALERNLHDKFSGDHDYAKTYKANKNKFRDGMSGRYINKDKVRTAKDEKRYREEKNAAYKAVDRISRNSSRSDMESDVRKYCGESTSIFNTLLDQV